MLLSTLGVEHLLVSALPSTSILPKAHVLNQRTMEILGDVGVAEPIFARSTLGNPPCDPHPAVRFLRKVCGALKITRLAGRPKSLMKLSSPKRLNRLLAKP